MKVVVGLGNPGSQYAGTRHNIGFDVVDQLAERWCAEKAQTKFQAQIREGFWGGHKVLLVRPMTFMNKSGDPVLQIVRFFQLEASDVVVICDDMNLPTGRLRWRASGSSGGQKGLADILQKLGTEQVPRLRLGVGRPPGQMDPADWVLSRFRSEERQSVEHMRVIAADSVEICLKEGIAAAMNRYNKTEENP
jgi:PTH1 family peptidyl-tRNA hydrolase